MNTAAWYFLFYGSAMFFGAALVAAFVLWLLKHMWDT